MKFHFLFRIDLHKSGCLCAVCVVRRRRREREGLPEATERQMETCDDNLGLEFKEEVCLTFRFFLIWSSDNTLNYCLGKVF